MRECKHNCEVCDILTDCIEESIEKQESSYYKMRRLEEDY